MEVVNEEVEGTEEGHVEEEGDGEEGDDEKEGDGEEEEGGNKEEGQEDKGEAAAEAEEKVEGPKVSVKDLSRRGALGVVVMPHHISGHHQ